MRRFFSIYQKHITKWLFIFLSFSILMSKTYAQDIGKKFVNQNCEYIQFVNDTLVDFMLIGCYQGCKATMYHGIGKYKIEKEQLSIIVEYYIADSLKKNDEELSICSNFKERINGIDIYNIEVLSSDALKIIGPIVDDYQKFNRRRLLKSFINWPWRWNFKKQHWYDPRVRLLKSL